MHYVVMLFTHSYGAIADKIFNRLGISDMIVGGELIYECNYILYTLRNVHIGKVKYFFNTIIHQTQFYAHLSTAGLEDCLVVRLLFAEIEQLIAKV